MGIRKTTISIMLLAVLAGCAAETNTAYMRDGKAYGVTEGVFRGRWWSYYERGTSFLAGQFNEEAIKDFEKAVAGRSTDSWRARTYGLHFVEYFPNRELGVAYYNAGRYDEAETYLNRALEQVDTDRAHHYIDLVKRAKIAQGEIKDNTTPEVATNLEEVTLVAEREVALDIAADDDVGVAEVAVNGEELQQRGSAEEVKFEQTLDFKEGAHDVEVVAKDLADKEVVQKKQVIVDLTGPTIGIFAPIEPTVTEHGTVILEGATVDKNGVISVEVGEQLLAESPGAPRLEFNSELPLGEGENTFVLAAKDKAGNETRSAVKVFKGDPNSYVAKLWLLQQKHPEMLMTASAGELTMSMLDMLLAQAPPPAENEIRLKSPEPEKPYRHNRTLRISGEVVTQTQVASLTINGEPFEELTGAPKESFNRRIPIENGDESVTVDIEATDEAGKVISQKVDVQVRPVELNTKESRMPVAVLAFESGSLAPDVTERLRLTTEERLLDQGRFRVLDRMNLSQVLTEQQLASSLADPASAIQLGKLTNAYVFLTAKIFTQDEKGLELKVEVINTETTDKVAILDAFVEDRDNADAILKGCDSIASQLRDLYPRVSGEIVSARAKGDTVDLLVDWTKEDQIPEGAYLLVVHEEEPWVDEDTGEVLEPGEFIPVGRAKILSFLTSYVKAQTVEKGTEDVQIEKGMPAITM